MKNFYVWHKTEAGMSESAGILAGPFQRREDAVDVMFALKMESPNEGVVETLSVREDDGWPEMQIVS